MTQSGRVVLKKHALRRRWMMAAFSLGRAIVQWLPLPLARGLGRLVGLIAYAFAGSQRRLTDQQLQQALGAAARPETDRRRIARGVFQHLGQTLLEWFVLDRCSPSRFAGLVQVHGLQHVQQALADGRGAIGVSAHFGNWEVAPMVLAAHDVRGGVLARRLRYPEYQAFLWSMRRRKGVETFERGSLREVARLLRANQMIGMLPDQDVESLEGIFVDFFGRPAYTPVGPAALSLMTGAPILPCFTIRQPRGFRVVIEAPIAIERTGDRLHDLAALTQAWSRVMESFIRRYPDQWAWMHRRWKTQPLSAVSPQQSA